MHRVSSSTTLEQVVRSLGVIKGETARSWVLDCPRCPTIGKSGTEKLNIYKNNGHWCCNACVTSIPGETYKGWDVWKPLALLSGASENELRIQLTEGQTPTPTDQQVDDFINQLITPKNHDLPTVEYPERFIDISNTPGQLYLAGRGIPLSIAQEYRCKYDPKSSRVIFPIEHEGRLLGWQGRSLLSEERRVYVDDRGKTRTSPKALTSKGLNRENVVMFWDRLKKSDFALIAEGPISAIKAHLVGGNIATLGKHVSQKQIRLIEDSGVDKIYLGLDADAVIECSTFASRTYLPVYRLDIPKKLSPDGKQVDLGDLEFSEVEYLVRTAKRWDATTSFAIPGL